MNFQLHFLEYAEIDHKDNGLKKISAADVSPGFFGNYETSSDVKFYPSPVRISASSPSQPEWPASGSANIAWKQANMDYFSSTLLPTLTPGSIGPVKYFWSTQDTAGASPLPNGVNHSPFYATAATDEARTFLTQDSGILV